MIVFIFNRARFHVCGIISQKYPASLIEQDPHNYWTQDTGTQLKKVPCKKLCLEIGGVQSEEPANKGENNGKTMRRGHSLAIVPISNGSRLHLLQTT